MRKNAKRALAIALTLLMTLMVSVFALGCGETGNYTVTLLYPDGSVVDGTTDGITESDIYYAIAIQVCTVAEDGEQLQCSSPMTVGANGKVSFTKDDLPVLEEGAKYKIKVSRAPEGYSAADVYIGDKTEITITLVAD